ncbi:VP1 [Fall chinook aquareovirus]|uniref:VP1 n=1 Tax=Fall chinook aquareovirus TaxID=1963254 RepID=UPI00099577EE|nr:VP1 [Fall chinook aquareovirus]AQU42725.1 VP1 [Fall chinook aquareovirus]
MAAVFGIQLTNRLNTASVRKTYYPQRYDHYITNFTTSTGINTLFRPINFNTLTHDAPLVQLYPPLNAWTPAPEVYPSDMSLFDWKDWLTDRTNALSVALQSVYPLVPNARRRVNPIVIGMVTSAFMNSESIHSYLPFLFYDPAVETPLSYIVDVNRTFSLTTFTEDNVLYTPAGIKFAPLYQYDTDDPNSVCTYGKHVPNYATVAYYETETARLTAIAKHAGGQIIMEHFDRPTYAAHLVIPRLGSPTGYGSSAPRQGDLLMVESIIDCLRQNASAGPSTAVARIDQAYHPVMNCDPMDIVTLSGRLLNLALIVTQGCQTPLSLPSDITMRQVNSFISQVMSPGDPQRLVEYRADFKLIWVSSPFPAGANTRYRPRPGRVPFVHGGITHVPDSERALQFLPQYRRATVTKPNSQASYEEQQLLPLSIFHGHAITAGTYFTNANITGDPTAPWPVATLPPMPARYFSSASKTRRELLSRLRAPSDRSYLKDQANFGFLASLLNPINNEPLLREGLSIAYLGAASTHSTANQPLIITDLEQGLVPGVPIPSKISQYGYDAESGALMDATQASPTGTFGLVYSDVDQVEDAGDRIQIAERVAIDTIYTALQMTTMGGVTLAKVNFPTPAFWTTLFARFPTMARTMHILKPMIVNSVEVFIVFAGRANDGALTCSPALHQYLTELFARVVNVMRVMVHVPLLGESDDGQSSLGINACRQYSPDLPVAGVTTDLQSLAYQLATVVPSTSFLARQAFDGTTAVTFFGKRTFLSNRRMERLQDIPLPITTAIGHQSRFTGPPSYQLFPTKPASVTQLMASAYNFIMERQFVVTANLRLLDCGTGPESRIIPLVPLTTDLTMSDTRPTAEALHAFPQNTTAYVQADFMDPPFWAQRQTDCISAIFSLGTAFAARSQTLIQGLTAFLNMSQPAGSNHFWLQLNVPLSGIIDIPGLIAIDARRMEYSFNGGQRVEPYDLPDPVIAAVRAVYPNATCSWLTPSPTLDWLEYVIGLGSSLSFDDIATVRAYGLLTPILHIDLTQPPVIVPVPLVVGVQAVIQVASPANTTTVIGMIAGIQVFSADGTGSTSTLGPVALVWDLANLRWDITLTPNQAGLLDLHLIDGPATLNRGSTLIALPPPALRVTFPPAPDFTVNGNDAAVRCHPFYRLGVFISVNGTYQPVNPERASVQTVPAGRILHYVLDLSDNHVLMFLCDIGDNQIGNYIAFPLAHLFTTVFPANAPLFASPPYPSASGRLILAGQPFMDLDPLPQVLPPGVVQQQLSVAVQTNRPTVLLPPGAYTYVVV